MSFLDEVDETVVKLDLQHDVRMLPDEIDQGLPDRGVGEAAGGG